MEPCATPAMERIKTLDFSKEESAEVFSSIDVAPGWGRCAAVAVVQIADRLDARADRQVVSQFCTSVATFARHFSADDLTHLRAAYLRFPFVEADARPYFLGLEATTLDLRAHLKGKVKVNWSFPSLHHDDATWCYERYLASLGEPGALDALAKKIARTKYGNDAYLFLLDLSESKIAGVDALIGRSAKDQRHTDGVDGPGMLISQWVELYLNQRKTNP